MSHSKKYTRSYYQEIASSSASSAKLLVPLIKDIIQPSSIADVGCGTGIWLKEWELHGVFDYVGLDGPYIEEDQLVISKEKFVQIDLDKGFRLSRKYDLVVSLEVAEHIQLTSAKLFVDSLCSLGDMILFSAAIPGQGGRNHLNEQYPLYWAQLFKENGFSPYDCIREKIWEENRIDACYRQNILFYLKDTIKHHYPSITEREKLLLPIIHPHYYEDKKKEIEELRKTLKNPLRILSFYVKGVMRRLSLFKKNDK